MTMTEVTFLLLPDSLGTLSLEIAARCEEAQTTRRSDTSG